MLNILKRKKLKNQKNRKYFFFFAKFDGKNCEKLK